MKRLAVGDKTRTPEAIRLLIVDDNQFFREKLSIFLKCKGFDIVGEAGSGEDAINLARSTHPDLVLMDVQLPGMDGVHATAELLKMAPQSRVIGLSLCDDGDTALRMMMAGACGFVPKHKVSNLITILRELGKTSVGHPGRKVAEKQTMKLGQNKHGDHQRKDIHEKTK